MSIYSDRELCDATPIKLNNRKAIVILKNGDIVFRNYVLADKLTKSNLEFYQEVEQQLLLQYPNMKHVIFLEMENRILLQHTKSLSVWEKIASYFAYILERHVDTYKKLR